MYDQQVRNGAAFLDKHYPEWREVVNWEYLDMYDYCILDQVDPGGFTDVVDTHAWGNTTEARKIWAVEHGFDVEDMWVDPEKYKVLTRTWIAHRNI